MSNQLLENDRPPENCREASTAIVLSTGTRFFVRFDKDQVIMAQSLPGATMFGLWQLAEIEAIEDELETRDIFTERVELKANIF
jgi:hypothetical protein